MSTANPDPGEGAEFKTPTDLPPSALVRAEAAALSHPGHVRPNNEDHYLVSRFGRFFETMLTNLPETSRPNVSEEGLALLVADGMGGHAAGEIASRLAVETLLDLVMATPDWILSSGTEEVERVGQRMAQRLRQIDAELLERARAEPMLAGMGTTLTLACNFGPRMTLVHIGDSRAYLMRGGDLHQLTRDHTLAQSLLDAGVFETDETEIQQVRHVLTRVLGGSGGGSEAEVRFVLLTDNDRLLLCSDGLSDMVDDNLIGAILRGAKTTQEACQSLVDQAMENGGRDNVTVALAHYRFVPVP